MSLLFACNEDDTNASLQCKILVQGTPKPQSVVVYLTFYDKAL